MLISLSILAVRYLFDPGPDSDTDPDPDGEDDPGHHQGVP